MAIPSKVEGSGNNSFATNVFKVTFSEATSNTPSLEALDNFSFNSTEHEVFSGTIGNSYKPMISAISTSEGVPSSDSWVPSEPVSGGSGSNRLKGSDSFVYLSSVPIDALGFVLFNLCWSVPFDASIPSDMEAVLVLRFEYTGPAPALTWEFNDASEGGVEASPVWTTINAGTAGHQIIPTDLNASAGSLVFHRPVSGILDCGEVWVTA